MTAPRETRAGEAVGVLLAGGLSRRMGGGDKCLRKLAGKTILERVIERARPQVAVLILNANGDPGRFADAGVGQSSPQGAAEGLAMVGDVVAGFAGPLAGVLTGLEWTARHARECPWVATFATDAPFLPRDLVARLRAAVEREGADMACARSCGRLHPVFALWPVRLAAGLRRAMTEEKVRKVDVWTARHRLAVADFDMLSPAGSATAAVDPFFNVNRPEDMERAEAILEEMAENSR